MNYLVLSKPATNPICRQRRDIVVDDSSLGQQLDEYRLDALLGHGGMARVYRAADVRLHRNVAIKVIDTPFQANQEHLTRFEREAQAIARLNHPNIVEIYRYGEAQGFFYIAMELIDGSDLRSVLALHQKEQTFISPDDANRIVRQVCLALDHLHDQGIIHRDIKPANIMLDKDGNAILTDFGLALLTEIGTQGYIFGTAEYMAPEQVISSTQATPQSDLYAVGIILYQMFTNRLPFTADHPHDVARMQLEEAPPSPRAVNPNLSPQLENVILQALAKKPQDRYPGGAALVKALEQALQQESGMLYKDQIRQRIQLNRRRLQKRQEEQARKGINTPPEVLMEIEDIEAEIARLEEELKSEPVNEELGSYRLATIRGKGGMARVYRAYDSKLARFVAVKVLRRHLSEDEAFVDRFYNEATTVANLKHPNIVQIYDFGEDRGKYYMVMELIDGDTLETKLAHRRADKKSFDLTETIHIFEPLAAAIDYAHAKGVVHHDLKPGNIMFEDQRVVLTDFGIAHLMGMADRTAIWARLGTPAYMAPEQVRGERGDARSDIYALGIILYEMVTGNEVPPLIFEDNTALSPALKPIILQALSQNPAERYQTAGELVEALKKCVAEGKIKLKKEKIEGKSSPPASSESNGDYQLPGLSETVDRYQRGVSFYQEAMDAMQVGNPPKYEKALLSAAPLVVGALEWGLKIYLGDACRGTKDYGKVHRANFHTMMTLMQQHAKPLLKPEQVRKFYDYREMRNRAEHDRIIPPSEPLGEAINSIRRFMIEYLHIEEALIPVAVTVKPSTKVGGEPPSPPAIPPITPSQRRRLEREKRDLETHIDTLSNMISLLRRDMVLEGRAEEKMRIKNVLAEKEESLAKFEDQLDEIERQLG
jgi:serine/threonine protein kinase